MRAVGLLGGFIGLTVLSACILGEAEKIGGGGGAGSPASSTGSAGGSASGSTSGMGGLGGMGGSPPACLTRDESGTVLWAKQLGGEAVPGPAHQRITGLTTDPDGIVVMAQYTKALDTPGFSAPQIDNSGHALLLWVTPEGPFVQDGGTAKNLLFFGGPTGGPPQPRALALTSAPYQLAVAGQFTGSLMVSGNTINAPTPETAAFTIGWDGGSAAAQPALWADAASVGTRFDDVVVASDGSTIVSGYSQTGMTVGSTVFPVGRFIVRIEPNGTTTVQPIDLGMGTAPAERIHLARAPGGAIFVAATLRGGSHTFGSTTVEVVANSGVLIARIDPDLTFTGAKVFQGPDLTGHQVFVRDLTAGPGGRAAVSGSFFGQLVFEPNTAKAISTASNGQNDGFVVVVEPTLEATRWAGFGSGSTPEVIASVSIDPCGDVAVMGTLRGDAMFGSTPVSPTSAAAAYVAKFDASAEGLLSPTWITILDHMSHAVCSTSTTADPFWDQPCFHVLATEEGVYAAGAFAGEIDVPGGMPLEASQGEDAYLLKLAP